MASNGSGPSSWLIGWISCQSVEKSIILNFLFVGNRNSNYFTQALRYAIQSFVLFLVMANAFVLFLVMANAFVGRARDLSFELILKLVETLTIL